MERRQFLKYIGCATVGCGFSACSSNNLFNFPKRDRSSEPTQRPPASFGKLEKTNLTIGFVPVTDCAPLIIAKEKGFFQRYGLNVALKKYPDWSAVHKDLLSWGIDACVALFGLPMLTNFGSAKAPVISL
ncbi:MAG: ABC transporter substrate-binding protein, partial [Moorea sp. SIO4A3]|nr:ABC transporter substrate-binding protein [Moorena sp. SIO4A3]